MCVKYVVTLISVQEVSWGGRSGKVISAGKHGVVVEANGVKHKVFWDEVESVEKPGKHGESAGAGKPPWEPSEPGIVDPAAAHRALEAAGWKAKTKGALSNSYEHPDHPGHVIGLSDEGAWAHNRFNVKLPNSPCCTTAFSVGTRPYPPRVRLRRNIRNIGARWSPDRGAAYAEGQPLTPRLLVASRGSRSGPSKS